MTHDIPALPPGRIDVHVHLLPAVDDGCASLEESLEAARGLFAAGYTHAFCTPHIWPNLPQNNTINIPLWTDLLQRQLAAAGVPLTVLPGGEMALSTCKPGLPEADVVTYALNRRYVLVDLWADEMPDYVEPNVRWLQSLGLKVILAHPERMDLVQRDPAAVGRFLELDILLQGNLACFAAAPGSPTRRTAERLLAEDRYFLLGSDLHRVNTLGERLAGLRRAEELAGAAGIADLTVHNPARLLPRSPFD